MGIYSVILAANRLPATLAQTANGRSWQPSPGGMAAALTPVQKKWRATWVGWSGLHENALNIPPFMEGLYGLHLDAKLYDRYYNQVANGALWPAFHGFRPEAFSKADWQAYQTINEQFADEIARVAKPSDLIWIHDFHLLLVPEYIRRRGLTNKIGLFLHIPFAGSEYLPFPQAKELLRGLLALDLCGVQTERDARQLRAALTTMFPTAKLPDIQAFPIGIDAARYQKAHTLPEVRAQLAEIEPATKGKHVVLSISRLDYTKGILSQLRAVERAVAMGLKQPYYRLIVSPSRESVPAYQTLKKSIDQEVARIQQALPNVLDYTYHSANFAEVCAWYCRADTLLVAPLIDGMNLVAKEYLATKPDDGVIILSTKAGAAEQLQQALLVDPTDETAIAKALLHAQQMSETERHRRAQAIRQNIRHQDVFWWAEQFIKHLRSLA